MLTQCGSISAEEEAKHTGWLVECEMTGKWNPLKTEQTQECQCSENCLKHNDKEAVILPNRINSPPLPREQCCHLLRDCFATIDFMTRGHLLKMERKIIRTVQFVPWNRSGPVSLSCYPLLLVNIADNLIGKMCFHICMSSLNFLCHTLSTLPLSPPPL